MASRQTVWELSAYRHFVGGLTKAKLLHIMKADTPEKKEAALKWIETNSKMIIEKYSKKNTLYDKAKEIFN